MKFWGGTLLGLILNFVSLYLPAKRNVKKLVNPAFIIGDFILIPVYFGLAMIFLKNNFSNLYWPVFFLAVPAVFFYGKQFKLIKKVWLLHGAIAVFLVGILLLSLKFPPRPIIFAFILLTNQLLGIIYPKKI